MQSSFGLDLDRRTVRIFVDEYYRHGNLDALSWPMGHLHALKFYRDATASKASVADEVRGPFTEAYRLIARMPGMPELQEPIFARGLQAWSEHVLNGAIDRSWGGCWDAHMILHFYRQFTPREYQTDAHMKVVYSVIAAFNLNTMHAAALDEAIDGSKSSSLLPAWHIHHPKSFPSDAAFLVATGNRILHHLLPESHPCKRDLIEIYNSYMTYAASYLCVTSARLQKPPEFSGNNAMYISIDDMSRETYEAFQMMRGGFYIGFLFDVSRLLACYQNILSTIERRTLWADTSMGIIMVLGIMDDIRDTQSLNIQLARRLPVDRYLEYVTEDMREEFVAGEPHNAFLWASLQLARGESTHMDLASHEREEIMSTLHECYQLISEVSEDAESKRHRLSRLCAMFLKYDIRGYIKEHLLRQELEKYFLIQGQAEDFNMPNDMLSYAFGSLVCQEKHSRSDEVAASFMEIMATPSEIMDEKEKVFGMLKILRQA